MNQTTALDVFLRELLANAAFESLEHKNWDTISSMFPGTTPYQCSKRYKEIKQEPTAVSLTDSLSRTGAPRKQTHKTPPHPKEGNASKNEKDVKSTPNSANSTSSERDQGPRMVIHVCDEGKNLRQDFNCPRDMLVNEMKYFAEYLSADAQRWEDVDISVHCDVQIFDWLMKYVKRGTKEVPSAPKLETTNVISILISSDFLKMDSLIEKCINFCHRNMNAILATPCNMNCINDKLVTRIAAEFSHNEVEELKDRKDKFRSKLFAKEIEKLFDSESYADSPQKACSLYKCKACGKILTPTLEKKLPCVQSRMLVDNVGQLVYVHEQDHSWDVNDWLIELKSELKTWRDVYWHIWGTVNFLQCSRCDQYFQCKELEGCLYHKDQVIFQSDVTLGKLSGAVGTYLCCGERVLRFDPTEHHKGCQVRDHIVKLEELGDNEMKPNKVFDDLMAYRDAIQTTVHPPKAQASELNVFGSEELLNGIQSDGQKKTQGVRAGSKAAETSIQTPKLLPLTQEVYTSEECPRPFHTRKAKVVTVIKPSAVLVDGPAFAGHPKNKWDASRSLRFNQDAQRQEDIIRLREMVSFLTRLRLGTDKMDRFKQREYAGGIYAKLEAQFRANVNLQTKLTNPIGAPRSRTKLANPKMC